MIKTAKKEILYHGTSSTHLRSILKQGLIPNPKQKNFNHLENVAGKFEGSYLGQDLDSAKSYANNAVRVSKGVPMIVMAQVETKSPNLNIDEEIVYTTILRSDSDDEHIILKRLLRNLGMNDVPNRLKDIVLRKIREANSLFNATYMRQRTPQQVKDFKKSLKSVAKSLFFAKDQIVQTGKGLVSQDAINFKGSNKIINILCFVTVTYKEVERISEEDFAEGIKNLINQKAGFPLLQNWSEKSIALEMMPPKIEFAIPAYEKRKELNLGFIDHSRNVFYLSRQGEIIL